MNYFSISDYFEDYTDNLTNRERKERFKIRYEINCLPTIGEQVRYIVARRKSRYNVSFDERIFGIKKEYKLDPSYSKNLEVSNEYYNGNSFDLEKYEEEMSKSKDNKFKIPKIPVWNIWLYGGLIGAFILLNVGLYVYGYLSSYGSTPFTFCASGRNITNYSYSKEKDGYFIPMSYIYSGFTYTGQNWTGSNDDRGKGVFASEDFYNMGGYSGDTFSIENYAVAARWEYVSYSISEYAWPGHESFGTADGVDTNKPYTNLDEEQYSWVLKQKVMVVNPENGKAVICMIGDGKTNPNWGGAPLAYVAGLSYKAQQALGFSAGGLQGEDYEINCRDSGVELEMYWAPEDAELGPWTSMTYNTASCLNNFLGIGNVSIADAAVTIAHETIEIATPNTGPNNGNGTDIYVSLHQQIFPGDPYYQSCDRSAATAVIWAGADDSFPKGNCSFQLNYLRNNPEIWQYVPAKGENDLQPGDILIYNGHIIVYTGNEAIRRKFPNAPSNYNIVHGSIGSQIDPFNNSKNRGPACGTMDGWVTFVENGGQYYVFRNIQKEENSRYLNLKG